MSDHFGTLCIKGLKEILPRLLLKQKINVSKAKALKRVAVEKEEKRNNSRAKKQRLIKKSKSYQLLTCTCLESYFDVIVCKINFQSDIYLRHFRL